jgi:single-strand DNA-binding protein
MANYNRVILAGNLTRDPELRFVEIDGDGVPVCSFGLAVNRVRSRNEEVDFFDISAWRELGETIANYKKKGGSKRSKVDVVADAVQFLGRGDGGGDSDGGSERRPGHSTIRRARGTGGSR